MSNDTGLVIIIGLLLFGFVALGVIGVGIYIFFQQRQTPSKKKAKSKNQQTNAQKSPQSLSSTASLTVQTDLPLKENLPPTKIVFGDEKNNPLIEISRYQSSSRDQFEEISLNKNQAISLSNLLQHAPQLAMNLSQVVSNTYVVKFAPEIQQGLFANSLRLMGGIRAIAVDSQSGRIVAHGSIVSTTGINPAMTALAVWQVLAIVTAQVYLSDIQKQLVKIEKGISEIKSWLEDKEFAALVGNLNYLKKIKAVLDRQEFTETDISSFAHQLEDIEREGEKSIELFRVNMGRCVNEFEQVELDGWFSLDLSPAIEKMKHYEIFAQGYLMAIYVNSVANQMRCALPVNREVALNRLEALQENLSLWSPERDSFFDIIERRASKIDVTFKSDEEDLKYRQQLLSKADGTKRNLTSTIIEINGMIARTKEIVQTQITASSQPVSLVVTLDEQGQVKQLKRVMQSQLN